MNRNIVFSFLFISLLTAVSGTSQAEPWPGWRGPRGDGTCIEKEIATKWDPAVAVWKTKLPGKGHGSPIVWGDYVCTVTSMAESTERVLICLDRNSGKILWQQTVAKGPLEKLHKENSYASGTPVTDGKRVYVVFRVGDNLIAAAHDLATGKQLWHVQLGTHKGMWGFANSPVLFKDKVIIDGDGEDENSFLIALNRDNGKTIWRNDRSNEGPSYSAPFIREMAGKVQMIQCGDRCVTSFDPDSGKPFWTVDGPSEQFVTTPAYSEKAGLIFVSSSWPKTILQAIRPDGKGNVTNTHVAWSATKGAPYTPSMIAVDDFLLCVTRGGTAYCFEAATGEVLWKEKMGRHHASPVLAAGLVFFINDDGQVKVIKPGKTFERVATYEMGESCYASPAISDGQVFVRGFEHLFCFGKQLLPRTPPIDIGVAGLSHSHVHGLLRRKNRGDIRIVGIAEPDLALAKRIAKQYDLPMTMIYDTIETMLDNTKPQAVVAFNSIYDHLATVEACAPRGVHVMVEKPLAVNREHARKMAALAKKHSIHLLTNYETSWYSTNHKAYDMVHTDNAIGQLRKIVVHDGHTGPKEIRVNQEFLDWLTDPVQNGGGAVIDFGCYGANLLTWMMHGQRPESVTCVLRTFKPKVYPNVDDDATIIVSYPTMTGIIQASWNWPFSRKDMHVYGETGYIYADNPERLRYRFNRKEPEQTLSLEKRQPPYEDPFAYFAAVLNGTVQPEPYDLSSLENNMIVVDILNAAIQSANQGCRVDINTLK